MKIENIPAEIKSKSLKEAKNEIDEILVKLENNSLNLIDSDTDYKRLMYLNKHVENLFKMKFKEIASSNNLKKDDKK